MALNALTYCLITNYKVMSFNYFVGIDVSKDTLDLCLIHQNQKVFSSKVDNSSNGLKDFWKLLLKSCHKLDLTRVVFCMEHTGIYNNFILDFLIKKKVAICLENPVQIKLSSGLQRGKSDTVDAERIARYASKENDNLRLWQPPRQVIINLKNLSALRSRLLECKKKLSVPVAELNEFDKEAGKIVGAHSKKLIRSLNNEQKRVDKSILDIIKSDETLNQLFNIITSVSGVGPVIAVEVLTTTNEFKSIQNPRKFACYAGVAPFEHSSGSSVRGKNRVSHKANKELKTLLHLGSMTAITASPDMKTYYERKVKDGKNKMSVLNAIRNKMIHRIFACVRQNRAYQKNYSPTLV
jgi:transposase